MFINNVFTFGYLRPSRIISHSAEVLTLYLKRSILTHLLDFPFTFIRGFNVIPQTQYLTLSRGFALYLKRGLCFNVQIAGNMVVPRKFMWNPKSADFLGFTQLSADSIEYLAYKYIGLCIINKGSNRTPLLSRLPQLNLIQDHYRLQPACCRVVRIGHVFHH